MGLVSDVLCCTTSPAAKRALGMRSGERAEVVSGTLEEVTHG